MRLADPAARLLDSLSKVESTPAHLTPKGHNASHLEDQSGLGSIDQENKPKRRSNACLYNIFLDEYCSSSGDSHAIWNEYKVKEKSRAAYVLDRKHPAHPPDTHDGRPAAYLFSHELAGEIKTHDLRMWVNAMFNPGASGFHTFIMQRNPIR